MLNVREFVKNWGSQGVLLAAVAAELTTGIHTAQQQPNQPANRHPSCVTIGPDAAIRSRTFPYPHCQKSSSIEIPVSKHVTAVATLRRR